MYSHQSGYRGSLYRGLHCFVFCKLLRHFVMLLTCQYILSSKSVKAGCFASDIKQQKALFTFNPHRSGGGLNPGSGSEEHVNGWRSLQVDCLQLSVFMMNSTAPSATEALVLKEYS